MINLDALKQLKPMLTAGSNQKADPIEFMRTLVPVVIQGVEGIAFGGSRRGNLLTPQIGQDFEAAQTELEKHGIQLQKEEISTNWPMELWVVSQAVLPFLSLNKDVVAYTSGNRIVGFAANPLRAVGNNISRLSSTVEEQQKTLQDQKLKLAALQKKVR